VGGPVGVLVVVLVVLVLLVLLVEVVGVVVVVGVLVVGELVGCDVWLCGGGVLVGGCDVSCEVVVGAPLEPPLLSA
jgi:hypothetical protein